MRSSSNCTCNDQSQILQPTPLLFLVNPNNELAWCQRHQISFFRKKSAASQIRLRCMSARGTQFGWDDLTCQCMFMDRNFTLIRNFVVALGFRRGLLLLGRDLDLLGVVQVDGEVDELAVLLHQLPQLGLGSILLSLLLYAQTPGVLCTEHCCFQIRPFETQRASPRLCSILRRASELLVPGSIPAAVQAASSASECLGLGVG